MSGYTYTPEFDELTDALRDATLHPERVIVTVKPRRTYQPVTTPIQERYRSEDVQRVVAEMQRHTEFTSRQIREALWPEVYDDAQSQRGRKQVEYTIYHLLRQGEIEMVSGGSGKVSRYAWTSEEG